MLTELVNYEYYKEIFGDSGIPESLFKEYNLKSSSKINYYTFNRINENNLDDNIRNTVCEIMNLLYNQDKLIKNQDSLDLKASETVGPHSVTYVNNLNLQSQRILNSNDLEYECYKICYKHLIHTGLMYRGI